MEENNKNDKLSFWQFLGTIKWLVVFNFKLSPSTVILGAITNIFLALGPLFNSYIFAKLLDKVIKIASNGSNPYEIIPLLGLLLSYNLIISAFSYINDYVRNTMGDLVSFKAPQFFYKQIYLLGIQTLENPEVVNKTQRAREVLMSVDNDFKRLIDFISRIIVLIFSSIIVLYIVPSIVAVMFIAVIPGLISNRIFMRKVWKLYRDETENKRRANFIFTSLIETTNLQEITITSAYNYLNGVYKKFADRFLALEFDIYKKWFSFGFLFDFIKNIASIFGYFTILKNLFNKLISVGDATFYMRSLDIFVNNLMNAGGAYVSLYERCIKINEIKKVFDMKPMVADGNIEIGKLESAPDIRFEKISFKYPNSERYIFKNLNLEIKPGEKIAIVGENGAGKTTLVKLLSRFYKVDKGELFLDNKNINDIKIDSWYKNLSVLFQDYNTYSALTLKENIFLGNSEEKLDLNRIEMAVEKANVSSFISNYKNKYEQVLSEKFKGGVRPSTGQWQKIAIARFFYRNSPVVVFDEPTASIDAVSESEIFSQIYDFFKNKTVIIISHRFSTVRNADKIYVLDKGEIIESGNHKQLMKLKGKYYKAFNIQAKGYE